MTSSAPRSRAPLQRRRRSTAAKKSPSSRELDEQPGRRTATRVALITAAGALLASVVGGLFLLFSGGGGGGGGQSSGSQGPEVTILAISFAQAPGLEIVTVTGTVRHIRPDEEVFAVARPVGALVKPTMQPNTKAVASWFAGGPAAISSNGRWAIQIKVTLSTALAFQAVVVPMTADKCSSSPSMPSRVPSSDMECEHNYKHLSNAWVRRDLSLHGPGRFPVKSRSVRGSPHH